MKPIISFTRLALENLQRMRDENDISEDLSLRIGVSSGPGCGSEAGSNYVMGFDDKKENDNQYEINGITVFIDKAESLFVLGMEIDWQQDNSKEGFIFNNPLSELEGAK